jgi:L27 domain
MKLISSLFYFQCVESLSQSNSPAAIELCDLLSTYEMEGLLQAHDRIATTTDRTPAMMRMGAHSPVSTLVSEKSDTSHTSTLNNNITKVSKKSIF